MATAAAVAEAAAHWLIKAAPAVAAEVFEEVFAGLDVWVVAVEAEYIEDLVVVAAVAAMI